MQTELDLTVTIPPRHLLVHDAMCPISLRDSTDATCEHGRLHMRSRDDLGLDATRPRHLPQGCKSGCDTFSLQDTWYTQEQQYVAFCLSDDAGILSQILGPPTFGLTTVGPYRTISLPASRQKLTKPYCMSAFGHLSQIPPYTTPHTTSTSPQLRSC